MPVIRSQFEHDDSKKHLVLKIRTNEKAATKFKNYLVKA